MVGPHAHPARKVHRPLLHPADMPVRHGILRVDRPCQRFDGAEVQSIHLREVVKLIGGPPGRIAIGEVQDGGEQQRQRQEREAVDVQLQRVDGEGRAERAADESEPEILEVRAPDTQHVLALLQRNGTGNRKGVEYEIQPGEQEQPWCDRVEAQRMARERLQARHHEDHLCRQPHGQRRRRTIEQQALGP